MTGIEHRIPIARTSDRRNHCVINTKCATPDLEIIMSKLETEANNAFRPSDRPVSEYEKEQVALRKNLERLRTERLAREKAKSKEN